MTVTPDTPEQDELADNLLQAVIEWHQNFEPANDPDQMRDDLAEPIAAIRRQAAADALREQARRLDTRARFWRDLQTSHEAKGRPESADPYRHYADQAHRTATYLRTEAEGIIAEGYDYECAAFAQECDARVPEAGDYCPRHEPEDDDNPWAE